MKQGMQTNNGCMNEQVFGQEQKLTDKKDKLPYILVDA